MSSARWDLDVVGIFAQDLELIMTISLHRASIGLFQNEGIFIREGNSSNFRGLLSFIPPWHFLNPL